jgi:hypothetical protein
MKILICHPGKALVIRVGGRNVVFLDDVSVGDRIVSDGEVYSWQFYGHFAMSRSGNFATLNENGATTVFERVRNELHKFSGWIIV